jgi:hypothetical protein
MHLLIPWQGMWLRQVVSGFYGYHAVPTNFSALAAFRIHVARLWRRALRRRSQKDGSTWARIKKLAHDFLPNIRTALPPDIAVSNRSTYASINSATPLIRLVAVFPPPFGLAKTRP